MDPLTWGIALRVTTKVDCESGEARHYEDGAPSPCGSPWALGVGAEMLNPKSWLGCLEFRILRNLRLEPGFRAMVG